MRSHCWSVKAQIQASNACCNNVRIASAREGRSSGWTAVHPSNHSASSGLATESYGWSYPEKKDGPGGHLLAIRYYFAHELAPSGNASQDKAATSSRL